MNPPSQTLAKLLALLTNAQVAAIIAEANRLYDEEKKAKP